MNNQPRLPCHRAVLALSLVLLAPAASPAQDALSPYREVIEVRVVNVEAVVEDRRGRRVTGLGPDAFTLLVDGREVPLEHFAEIRQGLAIAPPSAPGASQAGPEPTEPPALIAGRRAPNSYILFIDDYFAIGAHRNWVLDGLARQLGRLKAPDQAAIVAFGGRELELLSPWTSSRVELDRALAAAAARPAWGLVRFSERQRLGIPQFADSAGSFFPGLNEYELRREASALVGTMQRFADAPGRKVLIVLSGGWPSIDASTSSRQLFDDPTLDVAENDLEIMRPVIQTANLLGFTLYPIDLPGYRYTPPGLGAEDGRFDVSWRETAGAQSTDPNVDMPANAVPDTFAFGQRNDSFFGDPGFELPGSNPHRELLRQSTLRVIARDTGGRAILGSDRLRALERVVEDTGSYYWLSFTPDRSPVDSVHRIALRVEGEGLQVRTRRSYRDLSPRSRVSMVTLGAARMRDASRRNEVDVVVGTARRAPGRKLELPIRLEVPLAEVQFLPAENGWVADLELRLAAVDAVDRHTEMPIIPLRLEREVPPAKHEIASFETTVTLPRRSRNLAVSLFDLAGGKVLLASAPIQP